jgi:hypothetical protein
LGPRSNFRRFINFLDLHKCFWRDTIKLEWKKLWILNNKCNMVIIFILLSYSCVILLVTFKLCTHTKFWSWLMVISLFFLSLSLYIVYMWISNIKSTNLSLQGSMVSIYSSVTSYLTVFFSVGILLIIDGVIIYFIYIYDFKVKNIYYLDWKNK